jgi:hypothetical protein
MAAVRLRAGGVPPVTLLALAAALVLLSPPARADDCPAGSACGSEAAWRRCDRDQSALHEVRLQLRVAEQRLAIVAGDSLVLGRALTVESALVVRLRQDVLDAAPFLPGWAYLLLGGVLGVAGSVLLALSL